MMIFSTKYSLPNRSGCSQSHLMRSWFSLRCPQRCGWSQDGVGLEFLNIFLRIFHRVLKRQAGGLQRWFGCPFSPQHCGCRCKALVNQDTQSCLVFSKYSVFPIPHKICLANHTNPSQTPGISESWSKQQDVLSCPVLKESNDSRVFSLQHRRDLCRALA